MVNTYKLKEGQSGIILHDICLQTGVRAECH